MTFLIIRFAKHLVQFFFCDHVFSVLWDTAFLVNNCLSPLLGTLTCILMEKRSWAGCHSGICPKPGGMHRKAPRGFSEAWVGCWALGAVSNQPTAPCQLSAVVHECAALCRNDSHNLSSAQSSFFTKVFSFYVISVETYWKAGALLGAVVYSELTTKSVIRGEAESSAHSWDEFEWHNCLIFWCFLLIVSLFRSSRNSRKSKYAFHCNWDEKYQLC